MLKHLGQHLIFFHVQANPLIELLSLSNTQKATVSTFKAQHFLGN